MASPNDSRTLNSVLALLKQWREQADDVAHSGRRRQVPPLYIEGTMRLE
jgi:hypothetical protein